MAKYLLDNIYSNMGNKKTSEKKNESVSKPEIKSIIQNKQSLENQMSRGQKIRDKLLGIQRKRQTLTKSEIQKQQELDKFKSKAMLDTAPKKILVRPPSVPDKTKLVKNIPQKRLSMQEEKDLTDLKFNFNLDKLTDKNEVKKYKKLFAENSASSNSSSVSSSSSQSVRVRRKTNKPQKSKVLGKKENSTWYNEKIAEYKKANNTKTVLMQKRQREENENSNVVKKPQLNVHASQKKIEYDQNYKEPKTTVQDTEIKATTKMVKQLFPKKPSNKLINSKIPKIQEICKNQQKSETPQLKVQNSSTSSFKDIKVETKPQPTNIKKVEKQIVCSNENKELVKTKERSGKIEIKMEKENDIKDQKNKVNLNNKNNLNQVKTNQNSSLNLQKNTIKSNQNNHQIVKPVPKVPKTFKSSEKSTKPMIDKDPYLKKKISIYQHESDEEDDESLGSFIVDDRPRPKIAKHLANINQKFRGSYSPTQNFGKNYNFNNDYDSDDDIEVANFDTIQAEEMRTLAIGDKEDEIEERREKEMLEKEKLRKKLKGR